MQIEMTEWMYRTNKRRLHQVNRLSRIIEERQKGEPLPCRRLLELRKDLRRRMGISMEVLLESLENEKA